MTTYGERHESNGDVVALVSHSDGRVGLWCVTTQTWREVYGNGINQAGFIRDLLSFGQPGGGRLTAEGQALVAKRQAACA